MKILITAPAGWVGSRIVRELLAPEFSVRVLTRNPDRLSPDIRDSLEIVPGSVTNREALADALSDVEAFLWSLPAAQNGPGEPALLQRMTDSVAQGLRAMKTPRMVVLDPAWNGAPSETFLKTFRDSGTAVRHLRFAPLMDTLLWQLNAILELGVLSLPLPGRATLPLAAATDVADVALRWLVRRNWSGAAGFQIRGPEELSCRQLAATLEAALDRPVRFVSIAREIFCERLQAQGLAPEQARGIAASFCTQPAGSLRDENGLECEAFTRFASWLNSELKQGRNPEKPLLTSAHPGNKFREFVCL